MNSPTSPPAGLPSSPVRCGVGHLFLTHISRRYRERDVVAEARAVFPSAIVARDFDHFQVRKGEMVQIE